MEHHDTGRTATQWLRCAGIVVLALITVSRLAEAADQALLLDVLVNGHSIGKIGEFTMRDGELMARRSELRDLGFQVPLILFPKNPIHGAPEPDGLVALSDVPGLAWSIDQKTQELIITATDARLLPTLLQVGDGEGPVGRRVIETGTGVTLNYDIVGTYADGQTGASGLLDLRAFSPWGIVSSGWLAYAGATSSGSGKNTAIRLDSTYSFADVNTLRRYSLGDFITGGLAWTRPIHLEGVQVRSDFSMRPDLVTFPLPSVSGSVAVPSTLDVLADGNLVISREIDAGPLRDSAAPRDNWSRHNFDDRDQCTGSASERDAALLC